MTSLAWIGFGAVVILLLAFDLWIFNRKTSEIRLKEALCWSAFWIALALIFNVVVYFTMTPDQALSFFAGYIIERSLSIDNLFVFWVIFAFFHVPARYQNGVLFWGIVGALVIRAVFIMAGIALIHQFEWVIYLFGAFLIFTGIQMAFRGEDKAHPERNPIIKFVQRILPIATDDQSGAFFIKRAGKVMATPLFLVLLTVAITDVIFAVDSVPAILAITTDPFIVYTSNVFAVLGMRALYFAMAGLVPLFHYLEYGLAFVLVFVGIKMIVPGLSEIIPGFPHIKISTPLALGVIALLIGGSIIASLLFPPKEKKDASATPSSPVDDHH